jgi:hypothetical protein
MDQLARTIPHFGPAASCAPTGRASDPPTGAEAGLRLLGFRSPDPRRARAARHGAYFTETPDSLAEDDDAPMMDPCDPGIVGAEDELQSTKPHGQVCAAHAHLPTNCDCEDAKPVISVYFDYKKAATIFIKNKYSSMTRKHIR